jgi:hypothetical protein
LGKSPLLHDCRSHDFQFFVVQPTSSAADYSYFAVAISLESASYPAFEWTSYRAFEPTSYPAFEPTPYLVFGPTPYRAFEPTSYPAFEPTSYLVLEPAWYLVLEPVWYLADFWVEPVACGYSLSFLWVWSEAPQPYV